MTVVVWRLVKTKIKKKRRGKERQKKKRWTGDRLGPISGQTTVQFSGPFV